MPPNVLLHAWRKFPDEFPTQHYFSIYLFLVNEAPKPGLRIIEKYHRSLAKKILIANQHQPAPFIFSA